MACCINQEMGTLVACGCCVRKVSMKVSMVDLAERGCPTLGSSNVRRLVPAGGVLAQTISHAPLAAFTSVPGPHVSGGGGEVGSGGGEGNGGGGEGEGGGGEGEGGGGDGGGGLGDGDGLVQLPGAQLES